VSELVFWGTVCDGIGKHSTLHVPGRSELKDAPQDWPERLFPGSLNVRALRYPRDFSAHGLKETMASLDSGEFTPAFEILRHQLGNNRLGPRPGIPRGGDAQVWRARISADNGLTLKCWGLRRFGSGVCDQLEFVAELRLRDAGLHNGQMVSAVLLGTWR
jgi:hypothetical protein